MLETYILCLSLNIYKEARGEPEIGQLAVALVTIHRAKKQPDRICAEVYKYRQFTWTMHPIVIDDPQAFLRAERIARKSWKIKDFTNGATHFHASWMNPYPWWTKSPKMVYVGRWGNHIFYREKSK